VFPLGPGSKAWWEGEVAKKEAGQPNKIDDVLQDPVAAAISMLGTALNDALASLGRSMVDGLKAVADWIGEHIIKPLASLAELLFDRFKSLVGSGVNTILDGLTAIAGETFPVDVARPLGIIAAVGGTFIAVTAAIKLIDALHPFRSIVGESTVAMVYAFMGYEVFTSAFWRPVMTSAVEAPMRYWANEKFRPFLVDHGTADDMLFEDTISRDEWAQIHRWAGWREAWIDAHYASMDREPSVMDLVRIADNVELDPNWARAQLAQANFRQPEIEQLMRALQRRPVMDEVRIVRQQLLYYYRDGVLSREDLVKSLNAMGHQRAEVELLTQAADVMRARKDQADTANAVLDDAKAEASELRALVKARRDVLVEAYRRDLITDEDLVAGLLDLGMSQDLAGATLALEQLRKVPKPKRERLNV